MTRVRALADRLARVAGLDAEGDGAAFRETASRSGGEIRH